MRVLALMGSSGAEFATVILERCVESAVVSTCTAAEPLEAALAAGWTNGCSSAGRLLEGGCRGAAKRAVAEFICTATTSSFSTLEAEEACSSLKALPLAETACTSTVLLCRGAWLDSRCMAAALFLLLFTLRTAPGLVPEMVLSLSETLGPRLRVIG